MRLLDAARDEFATYGIAGARVDRIAAAAKANKAQIYHYFGSKEALFDGVFDDMVRQTVNEVPIDPANLPEYAARLHDSYQRRPWVQRLATWYKLERGDQETTLMEAAVAANTEKVAKVAAAQRDGIIPSHFSAEELIALVVQISSTWSLPLPEHELPDGATDRQRQIITDAVAALVR